MWLPRIFYPFGRGQGDSVVTVGNPVIGHSPCDGPINVPYEIFNTSALYVSFT